MDTLWSGNLLGGGTDLVTLHRLKLVVAALAALLFARRAVLAPTAVRRAERALLIALAGCAWAVYLNFFALHGGGTFVHLHDAAHTYLGAKYFSELRYDGLYPAMLRAEAESYESRFRDRRARDLDDGSVVHARELLVRSGAVRDRFTPARWTDFKNDLASFQRRLGGGYANLLLDRGFNGPPPWVAVAGPLANLVPAGDWSALLRLLVADVVLLAGVFVLVAWGFGWEGLLAALLYYAVLEGASLGWTTGSLLRNSWLFALSAAAAALQRGRPLAAGVALSFAALDRLFPAAFAVALMLRAVARRLREGALPAADRRLLGSFAASSSVLLLATLAATGWSAWVEYGRSVLRVAWRNDSVNMLGLARLLGLDGSVFGVAAAALCLALLVALALRRAQGLAPAATFALGLALLYAGVVLYNYYYVALLLLAAGYARRPDLLALLFAIEAATYTLELFEDRGAYIGWYRNVLVALAIAASLRGGFAECRTTPASGAEPNRSSPGADAAAGALHSPGASAPVA